MSIIIQNVEKLKEEILVENNKQATRNDLARVAKLMAISFLDYPFMNHSFFQYNFKNQSEQLQFLEKMCFIYAKAIFKHVKILISENQFELSGLAILSEIEQMSISLFDLMRGGLITFSPQLCKKYAIQFIKFFLTEAATLNDKFLNPHTWYLHIFAINPDYQGQKIGSKLMNEGVLSYIRRQQGKYLITSTNTKSALNFYIKNGFELLAQEQLICRGTSKIDKFVIRHNLSEVAQ